MLPDRICQLLTAYVDGELGARHRRAVERLLRRSAEARKLLQQLQHDAATLRRLPRQQLGPDFSRQVLQAITERKVQPVPRSLAGRSPRYGVPRWAGLATAAAVLLTISLASYFYFAASAQDAAPGGAVVQGGTGNHRTATGPERETHASLPPVRESGATKADVGPSKPSSAESNVEVAKSDPLPALPEEPRPADSSGSEAASDPVLTAPNLKRDPFHEVADPRLALVLQVRELDQDRPKQRLQDELQKDSAYRVELGCLESNRAFERLQTAFQAHGVRLLIEPDAQDRLKRRLRTNYVLYTENVTPDEVARVLQHLGQEDKKAEAKRRGDGQFETVVINRLQPADHQELSRLLGVDPKQLQPGKPRVSPGVDVRKPLSEDTADRVVQALKGQGPPRPEPGKPAVKPGDKVALVLTYTSARPRAVSKEVQQFLDSRKEAQPGTVTMLLVLRNSKG